VRSPLVVDASASVEHVLRSPLGRALGDLLRAPDVYLHAPAVFDVEAGGALRSLVLRRRLDPAVAAAALRDHRNLPIKRHGHGRLLNRAFELRENFGFADAIYVALAEGLGATLVTGDRRLARAARGIGLEVAS
jgi:predicted nucleic acid-binding protein